MMFLEVRDMACYDWSFGVDGSCALSDHRKKRHRGNKTARRKETKEATGFRGKPVMVTTYFDEVVCVFCGTKDEVEWMPA
jgi:hypothetical protein